ncbi:MAG: flagellar hook-basal body complex protein [Candidatus Gastranaerophilales bacterium]|nr:flagellar hook-basal body complex protein [Candidatus Gastranaerophilales bacterium]
MSQPLYTAMSGINAASMDLEVISNNVANINTTAFKASSVNFSDVYSTTISYGSVASGSSGGTNPIQIGVGTQVSSINKDFSTGSAVSTGQSTDLMLQGSGFFTVEGTDSKTYYTRAGDFSFDDSGNLVTAEGFKVLGTDSILSSTSSSSTVYVPTSIIAVVEGNANIGTQLVSALNNVDNALTTGDFTITVTDGTHTIPLTITLNTASLAGNMNNLASVIEGQINGTHSYGGHTYVIAAADVSCADGTMIFDIDTATMTYDGGAAAGVSALSFGSTSDTANFVTQTEIGNATITTDNTYVSKILDYTCSITDVTSAAQATSVNSEAINSDGSIQATYANGGTLSVFLNGAKYEFVYTTKEGVSISGDSLTVDSDVAVPANFVIQTATVTNTNGLLSVGNNLYEDGPNAGDIIFTVGGQMGSGKIKSGYLEASNVDLSEELSNMILAQRAIEANSRVFTTSSDVMSTIVNMGR